MHAFTVFYPTHTEFHQYTLLTSTYYENLLFLFISFFRKSFWTLIRPEKPLRWLFRTTQRPKMTIMISLLCRQDRQYLLALRGAQCPKDRQHLFDNFFLSFLLLLIFIRYHYKTVNTDKHYIEKVYYFV